MSSSRESVARYTGSIMRHMFHPAGSRVLSAYSGEGSKLQERGATPFWFWRELTSDAVDDGILARTAPHPTLSLDDEPAVGRGDSVGSSDVLDDVLRKLARLDLRGPGHLALEVVGHFLLLDRFGDAVFDAVGGFIPVHVAEHHDAAEDQ